QGVWLRQRVQPDHRLDTALAAMMAALEADVREIREDRRLEPDLRLMVERIRSQAWSLYGQA
ncbi:MAG TPA: histidine ammonia-lyase, partial [Burkholderiaceae bacterium]